jgi:hypothetical protein
MIRAKGLLVDGESAAEQWLGVRVAPCSMKAVTEVVEDKGIIGAVDQAFLICLR